MNKKGKEIKEIVEAVERASKRYLADVENRAKKDLARAKKDGSFFRERKKFFGSEK